MISDYFKRIENYLGNLTKDQKELLIKAKEQLSNGYQQESYMYDSLIKKQAYAIFYGPIYALQSTVILCNENSLAFFIRQPDKIFVHGCAHFPESYGLNKLFSLKKWNLGESKINLLEREADWKLLIGKISMIPRQHFFKIDFIKDKSEASEIYTDSKTPLYVFQNCLNEGQNNEIVKTIIHCYKKAPKGAIFAISSIVYADPKPKKRSWINFESTLEGLQSQIEEIGYSKIKKYNDELSYSPKFTSDDFKDLSLEQSWNNHGLHIIKNVLQPISDKYQDKYMAIKVYMSFKYILVRK